MLNGRIYGGVRELDVEDALDHCSFSTRYIVPEQRPIAHNRWLVAGMRNSIRAFGFGMKGIDAEYDHCKEIIPIVDSVMTPPARCTTPHKSP
jgi:hypothetical protein